MEDKTYVRYSTEIERLSFDGVEITINDPLVEKVYLKTGETSKTILSFTITPNVSFEDAREHITTLAEQILDKIAFLSAVKVRAASFSCGYDAITRAFITESVEVLMFGDTTPSIISQSDIYFINAINKPTSHKQIAYYKLFRSALQSVDPVARYIFLYSIILQIKNDKQPEVDNFIRANEPNVEESPRPDKPLIIETVYTRFRNKVGHSRKNTTPESTSREMKAKVDQLAILVKKAIEQEVT